MEFYEITVKGMMCEGCERRVKNALALIDGVIDVTADFKTGKVIVKANRKIQSEVLEEKIDDLGYEVVK